MRKMSEEIAVKLLRYCLVCRAREIELEEMGVHVSGVFNYDEVQDVVLEAFGLSLEDIKKYEHHFMDDFGPLQADADDDAILSVVRKWQDIARDAAAYFAVLYPKEVFDE